jgi:hypothetical protein
MLVHASGNHPLLATGQRMTITEQLLDRKGTPMDCRLRIHKKEMDSKIQVPLHASVKVHHSETDQVMTLTECLPEDSPMKGQTKALANVRSDHPLTTDPNDP